MLIPKVSAAVKYPLVLSNARCTTEQEV